jgi:hypothetical protein
MRAQQPLVTNQNYLKNRSCYFDPALAGEKSLNLEMTFQNYSDRSNKIVALFFLLLLLFCHSTSAQVCKAKSEIISNDDKAMIYIDGVLIGKGNVKVELTRGDHILRVNEPSLIWGRSEIRDTLKILDCNKNYIFNYDLKRSSTSSIGRTDLKLGSLKSAESYFSSTTFKILLGSAVVLGGIAAYFKIQADKKYNDYLNSKNQSTLDEVNRLDLYSGISFGLLQINFGYLIYKFLTD